MYEQKRILVTGATGLIGNHLVKRLLEEGAIVIAMGRTEEKLRLVFREQQDNARLSFIVGNIADDLPSLGKLDYVFHAASPISGAEIHSNPVDTISANINGAKNCLEYLKRQGRGRMILFSSATVYGNSFEEEKSFAESETTQADALDSGNTPYSESKRMIEVLARAFYDQYQVDSVIVRIGYVYGFVDPCPNTAFYEFIKRAVSGKNIVLNNSGMGRRDNIYVDDVVEGLLKVAKDGKTVEAYNLSSNGDLGNYRAIDEIAYLIAKYANELNPTEPVEMVIKPMEGERKHGMRLSNEKAKRLGWNIRVSMEEGIADTLKQYMKLGRDRT